MKFATFFGPDLYIGTTLAIFIWSGTMPDSIDKFTIRVKGLQTYSNETLTARIGIFSQPNKVLRWNDLIISFSFNSETCCKKVQVLFNNYESKCS